MGQTYSLQMATPERSPTWANSGIVSISIPPGVVRGNLFEDGLAVDLTIPMSRDTFRPQSLEQSPVLIQGGSPASITQRPDQLDSTPRTARSTPRTTRSTPRARSSPRRLSGSGRSPGSQSGRSSGRSSRGITRRSRAPRHQRLRRRAINVFEELSTPEQSIAQPLHTGSSSIKRRRSRSVSRSASQPSSRSPRGQSRGRSKTPRQQRLRRRAINIFEQSSVEPLRSGSFNLGQSFTPSLFASPQVPMSVDGNLNLITLKSITQKMIRENQHNSTTFVENLNQWLQHQK